MLALKQKVVSYICIIAMACSMMPFGTLEVEASEEIMGTKIEVNEDYTDKLNTATEVDWFTVEIKDKGYFQLQMKPGIGDINLGWKVSIYNDRQECIKTETVKEEFESCEYPFAPGVYYVKIQGNGDGSSWYDPVEVPYTFQIKYVQSNFWESEDNGSFNTSNTVATGVEYNGLLHYTQDADYYKFSNTKKGYFQIEFAPRLMGDDRVKNGWKISLYDGNCNLIESFGITEKRVSNKYPFTVGTFYVKVEAYIAAFNSYPDECPYMIQINEVTNSTWESEYNNSKKTADNIKTNTSSLYKGYLFDSDIDYYKFTLPASGKTKVSFKAKEVSDLYEARGWNVYLINAKTGSKKTMFSNVSTLKTKTVKLSKGTYYLLVQAWNDWYTPTGAEYNFKVEYSRTPNKPVISKVTTKKKTVTIKWKKSSYATGYYIYRATSKKGTYKYVGKTTKLSFTQKKLTKGKKYYYKVKAYRTYKGVTSTSSASAYKSIRIK